MINAAETSVQQRLESAGSSDAGRQRERNEDCWGGWEDRAEGQAPTQLGRLYLLSDGVGGNQDGDIASSASIELVMRAYYGDDLPIALEPAQRLERAILVASQTLAREVASRGNDMAATLVAALFVEGRLVVANIGDSRAYLVQTDGTIRQLSEDHLGEESQLTHAMGDQQPSIALSERHFAADEVVVLCSDGLHDLVAAREIARIVRRSPPRTAAKALIRLANRRAGHDNITVVIIRHERPAPEAQPWLYGAGAALLAGLALLAAPALPAPASAGPALKAATAQQHTAAGAPPVATATLSADQSSQRERRASQRLRQTTPTPIKAAREREPSVQHAAPQETALPVLQPRPSLPGSDPATNEPRTETSAWPKPLLTLEPPALPSPSDQPTARPEEQPPRAPSARPEQRPSPTSTRPEQRPSPTSAPEVSPTVAPQPTQPHEASATATGLAGPPAASPSAPPTELASSTVEPPGTEPSVGPAETPALTPGIPTGQERGGKA